MGTCSSLPSRNGGRPHETAETALSEVGTQIQDAGGNERPQIAEREDVGEQEGHRSNTGYDWK
jgi:hypothetical protein